MAATRLRLTFFALWEIDRRSGIPTRPKSRQKAFCAKDIDKNALVGEELPVFSWGGGGGREGMLNSSDALEIPNFDPSLEMSSWLNLKTSSLSFLFSAHHAILRQWFNMARLRASTCFHFGHWQCGLQAGLLFRFTVFFWHLSEQHFKIIGRISVAHKTWIYNHFRRIWELSGDN